MLCFKTPVRVLRLSRCRPRALRSTEANKTGEKGSCTHRQIVRVPHSKTHPLHQSDHRRDLDRRPQDSKPLEPGFEVRLARTQNMDRLYIVPAGERWACWLCRSVCCNKPKGQVSGLYRLPLPRNRSAVFDCPKGRADWSLVREWRRRRIDHLTQSHSCKMN